MGKWISGIFLGALAICLAIFTGSRTIDLLGWALPASQQIYQWLGLAAFEGGMAFWSFYFIKGAKGTPQRSISVMMAVFSILAVCICTIADLTIEASAKGEVPKPSPDTAMAIIIFVGIVIVLNVAAYLACHLLSVENMRNMKEQAAEDTIYEAGLKAIEGLAPTIAAEAAPYLAEEWANRTWQRIVPGVRHETRYIGNGSQTPQVAAPAQKTAPVVSSEPEKRGFIDKAKGFFGGSGKQEKVSLAQTGSIDTHPKFSEKTSNQIYREEQRAQRVNTSAVAEHRRMRRAQRFARPTSSLVDVNGNPITSASIKREKQRAEPSTEKVTVPNPLGERDGQADAAPTKSTRKNGSGSKKPAQPRGKTHVS